MTKGSPFRYFRTSPDVIRLAVMLHVRLPLRLRNVEDLLHERDIDICHETVRQCWMRFGPIVAAEILGQRASRLRAGPQWRWHLDEVFVRIRGRQHDLWRAVDHEDEVLEAFVSKTRERWAALKFLRQLMKRDGRPEAFVTDRLRSCGAALRQIGAPDLQQTARHLDNRAENAHLPFRRRERAVLRFRRLRSLQQFVAVHAPVRNRFSHDRSLAKRRHFTLNRAAALAEWRQRAAAA